MIKLRTKRLGNMTELRILINHPMYNGRIRDAVTGQVPPPNYIERLQIERNGALLIGCELSTGVSRDPYLTMRFNGGQRGDHLRVTWIDNLGHSETQDHTLD